MICGSYGGFFYRLPDRYLLKISHPSKKKYLKSAGRPLYAGGATLGPPELNLARKGHGDVLIVLIYNLYNDFFSAVVITMNLLLFGMIACLTVQTSNQHDRMKLSMISLTLMSMQDTK